MTFNQYDNTPRQINSPIPLKKLISKHSTNYSQQTCINTINTMNNQQILLEIINHIKSLDARITVLENNRKSKYITLPNPFSTYSTNQLTGLIKSGNLYKFENTPEDLLYQLAKTNNHPLIKLFLEVHKTQVLDYFLVKVDNRNNTALHTMLTKLSMNNYVIDIITRENKSIIDKLIIPGPNNDTMILPWLCFKTKNKKTKFAECIKHIIKLENNKPLFAKFAKVHGAHQLTSMDYLKLHNTDLFNFIYTHK